MIKVTQSIENRALSDERLKVMSAVKAEAVVIDFRLAREELWTRDWARQFDSGQDPDPFTLGGPW